MASNFSIQYSAHCTPVEEIEATDSSNKVRLVHSSIDKSVGGSGEFSCSTTATNVKHKEAPTTSSGVALNHASLIGTFTGCDFLMIKIKSAASTGTPDVDIKFSAGAGPASISLLSGVGDVVLLRPKGSNLSLWTVESSSATTIANIEILAGKD